MIKSFFQWLNNYSLLKSSFSIVASSLIASTLIVVVKQLGGFESFSLKTFDWLVQLRPNDSVDSRLLTVLITEEDIQTEGKWPISDATLAQAINILLESNPHAIGIDLYRDLPVEPGHDKLVNLFSSSDRISAVCKLESATQPAVAPPPSLPIDLVGFADVVIDQDGVVRRNLFYVDPQKTRCPTSYSLGLQLSLNYLLAEEIEPEITDNGLLKLGKTILQPIDKNMGAYQNIDANGYQIMLDYRRGENPAATVTLNEVLQGKVNPDLIKNKVVLLGVSAPSLKDIFYTPYSNQNGNVSLMSGVVLHTQMVSQLISAAIDGKYLIWSWHELQEIVWIYFWGLLGSISVILISRPLIMVAGQVLSVVIIVGSGVIAFLFSGWIPIIAPIIAFTGGAIVLVIYNAYEARQEQLAIQKQVQEQEKSIGMLKMLLEVQSNINNPPSLTSYEKGVIIVNRYEIIEALGQGSFGSTYLSRDLQRPGKPYCVVKRLTPSSQEPKFLKIVQRLFKTEAKILEKVGKHEQIPQLLAYIEEDQQFFLIEEYIEGNTLMKELREKKKYTEAEVLNLIEQIMSVLSFIQEYNLIHRDIKPDNIIRRYKDSALVLIDFGAVKEISIYRKLGENRTIVIGNESYAAPEQLAGQPILASDIYATGMLAIHCLTGILPSNLSKDTKTGDIIWNLSDYVTPATASLINKMVHYHFCDRYQKATEVLKDLRQVKKMVLV